MATIDRFVNGIVEYGTKVELLRRAGHGGENILQIQLLIGGNLQRAIR